jgi:Glu-tRNA(Gln) amidotransferase subunit E-like FAD-binding protein
VKGFRVCVVCGYKTFSQTADFFHLPRFHCDQLMAYHVIHEEIEAIENATDALTMLETIVLCAGLEPDMRAGMIAVIEWIKKIGETEDASKRSETDL